MYESAFHVCIDFKILKFSIKFSITVERFFIIFFFGLAQNPSITLYYVLLKIPYKFKKSYGGAPEPQTIHNAPSTLAARTLS
jgi:hypothetical protein